MRTFEAGSLGGELGGPTTFQSRWHDMALDVGRSRVGYSPTLSHGPGTASATGTHSLRGALLTRRRASVQEPRLQWQELSLAV